MAKGEKNRGGRPSKYKPEFAEQARKLCLLGATDEELADFFEVSVDSVHEWKKVHIEFSDSIKKGKIQADAEIANKLYHRASGYEHSEDDIRAVNGEIVITPTIKHYPPDTAAAIFWLKNRQRARWRDKQEVDQTVTTKVEVSQMTNEDIIKELKANGYSEHEINRIVAGIEDKES